MAPLRRTAKGEIISFFSYKTIQQLIKVLPRTSAKCNLANFRQVENNGGTGRKISVQLENEAVVSPNNSLQLFRVFYWPLYTQNTAQIHLKHKIKQLNYIRRNDDEWLALKPPSVVITHISSIDFPLFSIST